MHLTFPGLNEIIDNPECSSQTLGGVRNVSLLTSDSNSPVFSSDLVVCSGFLIPGPALSFPLCLIDCFICVCGAHLEL